jgi:hypothetical protein
MRIRTLLSTALAASAALCSSSAGAQQALYQDLRAHNASMNDVQPNWMAPFIQSDGRLSQAVRLSVSNYSMPGAHPIVYGNNHGVTLIVHRRVQFDLDPPAFFRYHSSTIKDGFGNLGAQAKVRLASGNAQHGNYVVSAILFHGFGARAAENQALSSYYVPSIAAGKAFGRLALMTTVGGWLPTGKVAAQGRAVEWNMTGQVHATGRLWLDLENNAVYVKGSSDDGKMQNMLTPGAFYMIRRASWKPEHPLFILGCALQTATSARHDYNHNLITELRVTF